MRRGRPRAGRKPVISIRIDPEVLSYARKSAIAEKKTLGRWLEEAIRAKLTSIRRRDTYKTKTTQKEDAL